MIHVQHAEERVYYALERLWKDCPVIPLPQPVGAGGAADQGQSDRGRADHPGPRDPVRPMVGPGQLRRCHPGAMAARADHVQCRAAVPGAAGCAPERPGREQAALAARYIAAMGPGAIFSSDLSRAAETAAALSRLTGLSVKLDPDLRERAGGEWEGLSDVELREQYGDAYSNWTSAPARRRPGSPGVRACLGGAAAGGRQCSGRIDRRRGEPRRGTRVGSSRLLGIPEGVRMLGTLGNCRWSVLGRRNSKWRLLEHNVGSLPEPVADVEAEVPVEAGAEGGTRREE